MPFSSSWGDLCSRKVCMEDFVKRRRNILWIYDKTQKFNRSFKQYSQEYSQILLPMETGEETGFKKKKKMLLL